MTGYLTSRGKITETDGNLYELAIPKCEIRNIITHRIMTRFRADIRKDGETVRKFKFRR